MREMRELQTEGERIRAGQEQLKKLQASSLRRQRREKDSCRRNWSRRSRRSRPRQPLLREAARRLRAFRLLPTFRMQRLHHVCLQKRKPKRRHRRNVTEPQSRRQRMQCSSEERQKPCCSAMKQIFRCSSVSCRNDSGCSTRASFLNGSFLRQNGRRWQGFIAGNRRSRSGHRSMHILADMRQRKSWQQLRRRQSEKGLSRIWR